MAKKTAEPEAAQAVTFPPGMLSEALGELERMQRVWRAFDAAHKAIGALASFEQVNRELAAERDRLAAEVEKLTAARDTASADIRAAQEQAAGILANAKAEAERVQTRAADSAARIEAEAQEMRRKAGETVQAAALERQDEEAKRDQAKRDLAALNGLIGEAKQKVASIKALAAA